MTWTRKILAQKPHCVKYHVEYSGYDVTVSELLGSAMDRFRVGLRSATFVGNFALLLKNSQ